MSPGTRLLALASDSVGQPLIIQTIGLYPSGAVWTDEASTVSRLDPSVAVQIDAEHPSRNRKVVGWNPTLTSKWSGWPSRPADASVDHLHAGDVGRLCGRSQSDAWLGCMVWSTTVNSSLVRVSRSTWSRSRVLNAAIVRAAS